VTPATRSRTLDMLVVGAGQAGLALGYHLKTTPLRFQLVERHRRIGDPEGYAMKDEIADYL